MRIYRKKKKKIKQRGNLKRRRSIRRRWRYTNGGMI